MPFASLLHVEVFLGKTLNPKFFLITVLLECECVCMMSRLYIVVACCLCVTTCVNADLCFTTLWEVERLVVNVKVITAVS